MQYLRRCVSLKSVLANGLLDQDDKTSSEDEYLSKSPKASNNTSTSSDAQIPDANDEVNTVTTVRNPYIILNDTAEVVKVDKAMIEFNVDNATDINTVRGRGVNRSLD